MRSQRLIDESNISGRTIALTLGAKPAWEVVNGVNTPVHDVYALCNHANINKWAKYSPKTRGGTYIPFSSPPAAEPFGLTAWVRDNITASGNMAEFANYDHDAVIPVILGFPSVFYSNYPAQFAIGITPSYAYGITLTDVIAADRKYFGVAIRQKNNPQNYIWGTTKNTGETVITVNLKEHSAWFPAGQVVEVIFFYSDAYKDFSDPYIQSDFWSLMCDDSVAPVKEFTLQAFTAPTPWKQLVINTDPLNGDWYFDSVTFNDIDLTVIGEVTANYRMAFRVLDQNNREIFNYAMLRETEVAAGETKSILSTGLVQLDIPYNSTQIFIQVLNLLDGNKVVAEKPIINFG